LLPGSRRARALTWPTGKAGVVTLEPASHAGHVVLGQGRRDEGGPGPKVSGGGEGEGHGALPEP
jgi:hypothetical protein